MVFVWCCTFLAATKKKSGPSRKRGGDAGSTNNGEQLPILGVFSSVGSAAVRGQSRRRGRRKGREEEEEGSGSLGESIQADVASPGSEAGSLDC